MRKSNELKTAGFLICSGIIFFIVSMVVAEALYPGYNISNNYVSDLGVGPSASIFNFAIVLLGVLLVSGAYFYSKGIKGKILPAFIVLAGAGAIGVGVFNENFGSIHVLFSFVAFLFGGVAALYFAATEKSLIRYPSAALGIAGLSALALFTANTYLGLGPGGMERMIIYPTLLWGILFSGKLFVD